MELRQLEKLANNPHYILSDKQVERLNELRKDTYINKNRGPKLNSTTFGTHPTAPNEEFPIINEGEKNDKD